MDTLLLQKEGLRTHLWTKQVWAVVKMMRGLKVQTSTTTRWDPWVTRSVDLSVPYQVDLQETSNPPLVVYSVHDLASSHSSVLLFSHLHTFNVFLYLTDQDPLILTCHLFPHRCCLEGHTLKLCTTTSLYPKEALGCSLLTISELLSLHMDMALLFKAFLIRLSDLGALVAQKGLRKWMAGHSEGNDPG